MENYTIKKVNYITRIGGLQNEKGKRLCYSSNFILLRDPPKVVHRLTFL